MKTDPSIYRAIARGARCQYLMTGRNEVWTATYEVPPTYCGDYVQWRIHPDDAELAYGPISNSLRLRAEDGKLHKSDLPYLHGVFDFTHHEQYHWDCNYGYDERALFLLIMAEAMADMGV